MLLLLLKLLLSYFEPDAARPPHHPGEPVGQHLTAAGLAQRRSVLLLPNFAFDLGKSLRLKNKSCISMWNFAQWIILFLSLPPLHRSVCCCRGTLEARSFCASSCKGKNTMYENYLQKFNQSFSTCLSPSRPPSGPRLSPQGRCGRQGQRSTPEKTFPIIFSTI